MPKIGEVVLIADEHTPRAQWKIGRIDELIFSADKLCRSVKLILPGGKRMNRPIKLLYPLELSVETMNPGVGQKKNVSNEWVGPVASQLDPSVANSEKKEWPQGPAAPQLDPPVTLRSKTMSGWRKGPVASQPDPPAMLNLDNACGRRKGPAAPQLDSPAVVISGGNNGERKGPAAPQSDPPATRPPLRPRRTAALKAGKLIKCQLEEDH